MIHGRQQQTARPMMLARATQKTTKNTSNARNTMQSLKTHKPGTYRSCIHRISHTEQSRNGEYQYNCGASRVKAWPPADTQ